MVDEAQKAKDVLSAPDPVLGPGEEALVAADVESSKLVELVPSGAFAKIEEHLFRRRQRALASRIHRVLVAGLEAAVVPMATPPIGDRGIVLAYPANKLLIEALGERLKVPQACFTPGVLSGEVREHLGVAAAVVPKPVIFVDAVSARRGDCSRADGSQRWRRLRRGKIVHPGMLAEPDSRRDRCPAVATGSGRKPGGAGLGQAHAMKVSPERTARKQPWPRL
jgi:hypothetical protein